MTNETPPDVIYLQWSEDDGDATWCPDQVNDTDVRYTRAGFPEELRQIVEILPGALTIDALADVANELLRANHHFAVQRLLQMLPVRRRTAVQKKMGD